MPKIALIFSFLCGALVFNSCKEDPTIPVLLTDAATEITTNSATVTGEITDDGGAEITSRGICWASFTNPTMEDNFIASGTGSGSFSCIIEGLDPNAEYHARAYAENSVGIAYGNDVKFSTGIGQPEVTTAQVSDITDATAQCGGNVTYDGGASITGKGICWSTSSDPDLSDSYVTASTGSGTFSCTITDLLPGTKYYVRAFVINSAWTVYGEQVTFNTGVTDIEGNLYGTVIIGSQVWMTENLRTTKFNDNTDIPNVTDDTVWKNLITPAYCWYNNDIQYKSTLGALYNWYTVETELLCPEGWHMPTDEEFGTLEIFLGMNPDSIFIWGWRGTDQGVQMKSTTGWDEEGNGNNSSGFTGLPGGYRYGAQGAFYAIGRLTYWWTASEHTTDECWYRRLDASCNDVYRASTSKKGGKYIRCIKN